MNKNKTLYFRKTHKLFIHLIAVRGEYHFNYNSASFADSEDMISTSTIQPNKTIDITTIDTLEKGNQIIDSEVTLDIYFPYNKMKNLVGRVSFDLKREKILNPNSSQFYKKTIKQGEGFLDGYIQYKFVALNTSEINEETYQQSKNHKNSIEIDEKSLEISHEYKRLLNIVAEKDGVIKNMEDQLHKLMDETKRLTINIRDQESKQTNNKGNAISLNINMKPSNKIEVEHKRLKSENGSLKAKMFKMSEIIEKIEREKRIYQQEIQFLKQALEVVNRGSGQDANALSDLQEKRAYIEQFKKSYVKNSMPVDQSVKEIKLQDMPEYSQINRKLNEQAQGLKVQIKSACKFDQFYVQKDILIDKLRNSIKEIDLLKDEIENMHVYIKKLTDQLKILRKNNTSEGIMSKIEAIRTENEKMIEQLRRQGNISEEEQMFAYRRENYLIEIELLKNENEEIKTRFEVMQAQFNKKYKEQEMKFYLMQNKDAELIRERDRYKIQLDEAKASLQKFFNTSLTHENIGSTAQELTKQLTTLIKQKQNLEKNLSNEKAAFAIMKEKHEQLTQEKKLKTDQFIRLTKLDSANKILAQKLASSEAEMKRYEKKFNQLKSFVLNIESTFKNKRKFASEQKYEEQMVQKLRTFETMAKQSEKQYVNSQIELLREEKARIIEIYYNDIKKQHEKIDADQFIQPEQKKILKEAREQELSKEKDKKLLTLDQKLLDLNEKKIQIDRPMSNSMSVPQRLASLEKIMKSNEKPLLLQSQNDRMKESIARLKQAQQIRNQQIQQLKESQNKLAGSGVISGIQYGAFAQSRQKYMEQWTKMNDDTKKRLQAALTESNEVKIKCRLLESEMQKVKFECQRQKKQKDRQLQIERIKIQKDTTLQINKIEKNGVQINKLKSLIAQLQFNIASLQQQLKKVSIQNDARMEENIDLSKEIERNRAVIDESNRGVDIMMKTLEELRVSEREKVSNLQILMEKRSEMFIKIQKVKDVEISQLKRVLKECEDRMEAQTYEGMKLKEAINELNMEHQTALKEKQTLEETLKLQELNFKKQLNEFEEKVFTLQNDNQLLESNLINLAEQYSKMQEQLAMTKIQLQAMEKERQVYKKLQARIIQIQSTKNHDKQEMTYIILDKKQQLRKYETEFLILQEKIKIISEESQKLRQESNRYQVDYERLREKLNEKCLEIISITEQKSLLNIEKTRKQNEIEEQLKKIAEFEAIIDQQRFQLDQMELQLNTEREREKERGRPQFKKSQSRRSPRVSRHVSIQEIHFSDQKKPNSEEKPVVEVENIEHVQSLENLHKIQEENINEPEVEVEPCEEIILENLETKSIKSDRSNITKKSNLSKRSKRYSCYSMNKTPEMVQRSAAWYEREQEFLNQLSDLGRERDELLDMITEMKMQIEKLKFPSDKKGSENIKIDDSTVQMQNHSGTFSLGHKINFLDSRQLNNTNEGTDKEHSKDAKDLELFVEQLERDKDELKHQLAQERQNIEKLFKTTQELQHERNEVINQIEQIKKEYEQKCIEAEEVRRESEDKIQAILSEMMEKENNLATTMRELENARDQYDHLEQELNNYQVALDERNRAIQDLTNKIKRIKNEYRKYEEQAELEILTLRQKFDEATNMSGQKNDDIQQLVEKYISLEDTNKLQEEKMIKLQNQLQHAQEVNFRLEEDNNKIGQQRDNFTQNRKKMSRRIHELEVELLNNNEKIIEANKSINLTITKSNIKIQAMQQQLADSKLRLEQKQKIVLALKNEIALYNQQCMELKRSNEELDYEIQKITKELKDIMVNYQLEFETVQKQKLSILESVQSHQNLLKEKQHKLSQMRAEMRENQRERVKAQNELREVKQQFQRYKNIKSREWNEKCTEFQLKNNELETLKSTFQKITQENFLLESQADEERKKYKTIYDEYREKMARYEESLEQVSKELIILSDRPSKQSWEQAVFQNQLYRNRIEQLEEQAKKKVQSNDDLVIIQFRKYKSKSEIVIRNLQLQMEGYSNKINELQEGNFYLRKENDSLRSQLMKISEAKYDLQQEIKNLQEDILELKQQVEFYKSKRRNHLKLLNETDD